MAQLIVKSPYLPPNLLGKIGGYLRYISTREGVEKIKQKNINSNNMYYNNVQFLWYFK